MKRKQRRGIEEFSVSFLDVICCGFGAIILLLMITKTVEPVILEKSQINLEGVVEDRENALFEIRGQVRELKRQVTDSRDQLDDNLMELAALERELTEILGQYQTTVTLETKAESETTELAAAKQTLTDEMQRLLGRGLQRSTELVGGIAVDSEYIIFVIDTSGSPCSTPPGPGAHQGGGNPGHLSPGQGHPGDERHGRLHVLPLRRENGCRILRAAAAASSSVCRAGIRSPTPVRWKASRWP